MRKIVTICLFEIKRTFKKKSAYVLMFAMPVLFTFLFGSLFGSSSSVELRMAIVDEDQSAVARHIIKRLLVDEMITYEVLSAEQAAIRLEGREVQGVVIIKEGVADRMSKSQPVVEFNYLPGTATAPLLKQQVNQAISAVEIVVASAQTASHYLHEDWSIIYDRLIQDEGRIQVFTEQRTTTNEANGLTAMSYSSAGFTVMFVMMMMLTMTGVLIEARQMGIWSRLFTTPVTRFQVLTGYFLSFFIVGWIQFGVLIGLSSILFKVEWGNLLALLILITSLLICVVGLGIAIACLAKTSEQQSAFGTLIIISTCMLGGVYWPITMVPDTMQKIAHFVPQSWAMEAFTAVIADGGSVGDIWLPIVMLLVFATVFLSIGLSKLKYV